MSVRESVPATASTSTAQGNPAPRDPAGHDPGAPAPRVHQPSGQDSPGRPARRAPWRWLAFVLTAVALLFAVPWWTLVLAGWPTPVAIAGTVVFAVAAPALPVLMFTGHGRGIDGLARVGDTLLGVIWVLFAWSVLGNVLRVGLLAAGVHNPARDRTVAVAVLAVVLVLLPWGVWEALRVPRVRRVDVTLPRLGPGLHGTRVVVLADTHYGPIDRSRWAAQVAEIIAGLEPDIICHAGDIADGSPQRRRAQAAPLGTLRATLSKVYVTGNHEYFSAAGQSWIEHMGSLGWQALHNRHVTVERGGDRLVLAGIDDRTAAASGDPGHGADIEAALAGVDPDLPVLLLAHQPHQITHAVRAGVDLQISGHTHGGQIWPFHYLVRIDQPVLQGLTRHGARTQLYTSRGTGFWGPPLRIFAPSEITVLTLLSG